MGEPRGGARRARGRRGRRSSPPAWRRSPRWRCRRCGPATSSSRRPTRTRACASIAREHLSPRGVEVRLVPTEDGAVREALHGRDDGLGRVALEPGPRDARPGAAGGRGARGRGALVVDNTLAGTAASAAARARRGRVGRQRVEVADRPQRPGARVRRGERRRVGGRAAGLARDDRARSRAPSRHGSRTARSRRSPCGSSARRPTRPHSSMRCAPREDVDRRALAGRRLGASVHARRRRPRRRRSSPRRRS